MTETAECATSAHPTFDDWLVRHQDQLYRYALHLARDRGDADALYQETVLTAYRGFDQLDGRTDDRAWLYRIATEAFLNKHQKRSKEPSHSAAKPEAVPAVTGAIRLTRRNKPRDGAVLPESLPVKQRLALIQRMYHDVSYAEIAASLRCSETAARASVYQALRTLRMQCEGL